METTPHLNRTGVLQMGAATALGAKPTVSAGKIQVNGTAARFSLECSASRPFCGCGVEKRRAANTTEGRATPMVETDAALEATG